MPSAVTLFGKEIRKMRLDADVTLSDMAEALDKKASYLSAVELGDKPLSEQLVKDIIKYFRSLPYFRQHRFDEDYVLRLADRTRRIVPVEHLKESEKEAVAAFARRLPELSDPARAAFTKKLEELLKGK
jgi:transcriptional regulator with XRE-family HTH domain